MASPLQDAEELYERAPCGYLTTSPDGTITRANATFLAWTGHRREEVVGRAFASLLSAGGRIYYDTHLAPMLRLHGTAREIALEVVRSDGGRLPVLATAALERDAEGNPVVVRVILLDATERREYERELLRAKQRAEEAEARARSLAATLQRTLIPPRLPDIPGLRITAAYRPAGVGEEIGGDFYDAFQVGPEDWVLTVGDVCGKGVEAAVVTALIRHTLRAVTVRRHRPVDVLRTLNEVLLHHPTERFCTVALARLRLRDERWRLTMSLGGHPPGVLVGPTGPACSLGHPGTLVGVVPGAEFHRAAVELQPGSTLVLYTDGVTEARVGSERYGDSRLRRVIEERRHSPSIVDDILADLIAVSGGALRDDVALVAVTVPH